MLTQPRSEEDAKPPATLRLAPDDRPYLRPPESSWLREPIWIVGLAIAIAASAAGIYIWQKNEDLPPAPTRAPAAPAGTAAGEPAGSETPKIQHPVESPDSRSLPGLTESDAALWAAMGGLANEKWLAQLVYSDQIIRRIVATVDSLPRKSAPVRMMPFKPVPEKFKVGRTGVTPIIAPENSARYRLYVRLAQSLDARSLVNLYMRYYPLFQNAYAELGYPHGYFNDRLVEAIDDLVAAPALKAPIRLARPRVLYEFEAADLENRSAGQKMMMRMGAGNASKIRAKLLEIRAEIVRQPAKR